MESEAQEDTSRPVASVRTAEIVVAVLLLGLASVFLTSAIELGHGWIDGQGPGPGYFPFYLAVVLVIASMVNLLRTASDRDAHEAFTTISAAGRVLAVFLPALIYVALIGGVSLGPVNVPGLGIYVASAIFIAFFMMVIGSNGPLLAITVGLGVPVVFFLIFERWFLVPLPKGPIETILGLA